MRTMKQVIDSIPEWKKDEYGASYARTAAKYFGSRRISRVTQEWIDSLIGGIQSKVSPATLNRHVTIIKRALTAAGLDSIRVPKVETPEPERAGFNPSELAAVDVWMDNNASPPQHCLYILLRDTGARPGREVSRIDPAWIYASNSNSVRLYSGKGGKGLRYRDVPLSEEAKDACRFLYTNNYRMSDITGFNALWRKMVKELFAGDPTIVPYTLRHTFARRLINAQIPIHVVSRMMGHASIETTMQYIRVNPQETDMVRQALSS